MIKTIIRYVAISPLYVFNKCMDIVSLLSMSFKRISRDYQLMHSDNLIEKITHISANNKRIDMSFYTPNSLCMYRAETFSDKEPETLAWIEEFGCNNATLFDIGANIGLYSIYHNKINNGKCIAFEPSFFNLKLLAKNINVNNCQHLTTVITNPLSSETRLSNFKYGSTVEGGALSAFGVDFGYDGEKIQNNMQLNVLGVSLDWMFESQIIDVVPNLVKIDVDGIEHIVLQGAKKILEHVNCKSVLVEVNDAFKEQSDKVAILLESFDFILRGKFQGDLTNKSDLFSDTFNQIWVKK
jgi:FkbM family methyltransferase